MKLLPILLMLVLVAVAAMNIPPASAAQYPIIPRGWGGSGLKHTQCGGTSGSSCNSTFPASVVFPGEPKASKFELQAKKVRDMGYSAIRASFDRVCTPSSGTYGDYNSTQVSRALAIAAYYDLYLILDYHGYQDMQAANLSCWLNFWSPVVNQFKTGNPKLIWEPLNEPDLGSYGHSAVTTLSTNYQLWIDQARALGDTHDIIVQNLCSYRCDWPDFSNNWADIYDGYPTVTDVPLGKIYLSVHPYFSYEGEWDNWSFATADVKANAYFNAMVAADTQTIWPILNTEGGTAATDRCLVPESPCPPASVENCPDLVLSGSAGYCDTSFRFIQTLTNKLDGKNPLRIYGYLWFPMASWTNTPGAGTYGALSPNNGWGTKLTSWPPTPYLNLVNRKWNHGCGAAWLYTLTWSAALDAHGIQYYAVFQYGGYNVPGIPVVEGNNTSTTLSFCEAGFDGWDYWHVLYRDTTGIESFSPVFLTLYVGCPRGVPCPLGPAPP